MTNKRIWKKWTLYCATGELLGIGCAGAMAFVVNSVIGEPKTLLLKLCVLLLMLLAGFIEGLLLGIFQWNAIKYKFPKMPGNLWVLYTVLVAVLGWFLGMLPSLFFLPTEPSPNGNSQTIDFNNPIIFALLSIGTGMVLGALFGLFQWFVLRRYAQKAYRWIIANALGWGLGLGWIYLFASLPDENTTLIINITLGVIGGLLAGLCVGGVTGLYLIKMKEK